MQTGRLFDIIFLLMDRGTMTAVELAEHFEVSHRTIRRDIDRLSAAGIPVYMTQGRGGGVHLMPNFVMSKSLLTSEDQEEILAALQALEKTGASQESPDRDATGSTINTQQRLATLFQKAPTDWIDIDFSTWGTTPFTKEYFQMAQESILGRKVLAFDYFSSRPMPLKDPQSFEDKAKQKPAFEHREVEPYKLFFRTNCWYMQAYCLLRDDWRYFKLSRIANLSVTNRYFEPRGELPAVEGDAPRRKYVQGKIRFSKHLAFRVLDEFPTDQVTLLEDGSALIEGDVPDENWVPSYLLSYGSEVEVFEPEKWRAFIIEQARKISQLYKTS